MPAPEVATLAPQLRRGDVGPVASCYAVVSSRLVTALVALLVVIMLLIYVYPLSNVALDARLPNDEAAPLSVLHTDMPADVGPPQRRTPGRTHSVSRSPAKSHTPTRTSHHTTTSTRTSARTHTPTSTINWDGGDDEHEELEDGDDVSSGTAADRAARPAS